MAVIEVLRRLVFLAGMLTAGAMVVWPAQAVYRIQPVDFAQLQQRRVGHFSQAARTVARAAGLEDRLQIDSPDAGDLDQFIRRETADRLVDVSGAQWEQFFSDAQATLAGRSQALIRHVGQESSTTVALFFALDQAPLNDLSQRLHGVSNFSYLRLDGQNPRYLAATLLRSGDMMRYAPNWLAFPMRQHAAWVFCITLAVYLFLPRRSAQPDEVCYSPARSAILPDILGIGLTGLFFLLPILIISTNASSYSPWSLLDLEGGWIFLTLILWGMAAISATMFLMAAWYASFRLRLLPDGFQRSTLLGTSQWSYSQMASVEEAVWALPRWLRWTMIALSLLNWRLAGAVILGANTTMNGIAIRCRDGRQLKIWFDYLQGAPRILAALQQHGIPLSPALQTWLAEQPPQPDATSSSRRTGRTIAVIVTYCILAGAALAATWWPSPTPSVTPAAPAAPVDMEALAAREAILAEMKQLNVQMRAASAEVEKASPQQRPAALKKYNELFGRFQELSRRFDNPKQTSAGK